MAHSRGLILCILGAWGVVGVYMGMNVGCSASCTNIRVGGVLFVGIHEHTTMLNEYLHNLLPDGISRRAQQTPSCTSRPSRPRSQETSKEQRLQSSLQRPPVIGGATRTLEHTAPLSPHWLLKGIPTYESGAKGMGRRLSYCQSFPVH